MYKIAITLSVIIFLAAACNKAPNNSVNPPSPQPQPVLQEEKYQTVNFLDINSTYKFSAKIKEGWKAEYIPSIESINIYDPSIEGKSTLEQSQIFIRYFSANSFLTLTTVDILSKEDTQVSGRAAVRYEIRKKAGIPNFANQPSWRSEQHKLVDVRLSETNPSLFYVFAYNPNLKSEEFEKFLTSLEFK